MSVFGVSMCKDECDIIGHTVSWMLTQVDKIIIADNGSTDGTTEILDSFPMDRVIVKHDRDVAYYQSQKMTKLAQEAAGCGADWIIPFDSDEIWYSPFGHIGDVLAEHPTVSVVRAPLYDHVATAVDPNDPDPVRRIGWRRRDPVPLEKIACRSRPPLTIHQGNHSLDYGETIKDILVVRHFPYRSVEQFVKKVRNGSAAYAAATDLPEEAGKHWRDYGRLLKSGGEESIEEVFLAWFWSENPAVDPTLIYDPINDGIV